MLEEGPWVILGHYLSVMRWRPNFWPSQQKISTTLVWVRFRELPLEVFDEESLADMGDMVGRTVKVNPILVETYRGRYARVCVEVQLDKPLLPSITFLGESQLVEYEGLHLICFSCGKYGHKGEACPEQGQQASQPDPQMVPTPEHPYGPWMLPKNHCRRFSPRPPSPSSNLVEVELLDLPDTLAASGPGHQVGPIANKPTKPGDTRPGSTTSHCTRFDVMNGIEEDGSDLVQLVAKLKKQIVDIPGPNTTHQPGVAHARGTHNRRRAGKQPAHSDQLGQARTSDSSHTGIPPIISAPMSS